MKVNIVPMLKSRDKSMYWLAREIDMSYKNLHNLCNGKTSSIQFYHLEKICVALNCDVNEILVIEREG